MRRKLSMVVQEQVRQRARYLCEYCHTAEQWQYVRFTLDHIISLDRGGSGTIDNLALACFHCNRRKTNKITGIDPVTEQDVPLFNPRQNVWREHFIWSSNHTEIIGLTPTGRATIETLVLNRDCVLLIRAADIAVGRHPPEDDPRL